MRRVAYILVLLVALAVPASAYASPAAVIRDCADNGKLDHHYSNSDLQGAQKNLPADLDEYSDCRSVIAGSITGGSDKGGGRHSGGGGPSGGAGSSRAHKTAAAGKAAKAQEKAARARNKAALEALKGSGSKPRLSIGGKTVEPGGNGLFNLASAANGLPLPLLLALIAVGVLTAVGAVYALRRHVPALARIPRPRRPVPRLDLSRVPFARSRR